jgi:uncharacterized protein YkwD
MTWGAAARPLLVVADVVLLTALAAAGTSAAGASDASTAPADPGGVVAGIQTLVPTTTAPVLVELEPTTTTTATTAPPPPPPPPTTTTTTAPPPPTTTAPPPPPPAPPPAGTDAACEQYLFDRTNAARAEHGLPGLAFDERAHRVARRWSSHNGERQQLGHNPRFGDELAAEGVPWWVAGENVGQGPAAVVFDMWMASATHRANILEPDYAAFAVGCVEAGGQLWSTQNLWG